MVVACPNMSDSNDHLTPLKDGDRARLTARLHVVDGLLFALDHVDEINSVVRSSADRTAAVTALAAAPFHLSEVQAQHVLDIRIAQQTAGSRFSLEDERARLRSALDGR
ncbi:MAG: hypothetical protein JOY57_03695 [Actinobacteria bacterium]|nr:hypothetical protein [Actinomycetota bacterium]